MARKQTIITNEIYQNALNEIRGSKKNSKIHFRLKAIISSKEHSIKHVSTILKVMPETLRSWVRRFAEGGAQGLEDKQRPGRKSSLTDEHTNAIKIWLEENNQTTIQDIRVKLSEKFNIQASKSSIHRTIKKLNFSYITPRPRHYKQNRDKIAEFKKKSVAAHEEPS
jgi:transposase